MHLKNDRVVFVTAFLVLIAGGIYLASGLWGRVKLDQKTRATIAQAPATDPAIRAAEGTARVDNPAATESSPLSSAPSVVRSAPQVFGLSGPVHLEDVPAGVFRTELGKLPEAARNYALQKLGSLHVPLNDCASLHADSTGHLYYECAAPAVAPSVVAARAQAPVSAAASPPTELAAPVSILTPPVKHSKPGASKVIYLDFNGHNITGTQWNMVRGSPGDANYRAAVDTYVARPFHLNGSVAGTFDDAEQTEIIRIWERVAEDYAPFDVDVTTEEPATFTSTTGRVLITTSTDSNGVAMPGSSTSAGIAYLDVFGDFSYVSTYSPALVYADKEYYYEDYIAEAASHEMGHNLSLSHDGTTSTEYYSGHGTGETSWGPLMGTPYNKNVSTWSKGEYFAANNTEDDLALISGHLGYASAAPADNNAAASALTVSGTNLTGQGVIGTPGEADRFSFSVTGLRAVDFTVTPWRSAVDTKGGNLDVALQLYDSSNTLVASNDASNVNTTSATLSAGLAAGTYYLRVSGTGTGNPVASTPTGYTSYGSLGQYTIAGATSTPTAPAFTQQPSGQSVVAGQSLLFSVSVSGSPGPTFQWQGLPAGSSTWANLSDGAIYTGTATQTLSIGTTTLAMNGSQFRCVATNVAGSITSNVGALTVSAVAPSITTQPLSQLIVSGNSVTFTAAASGIPTPTYQWLKNGVNISGATTATLTLPNIQTTDAATYSMVATNAAGTATTAGAVLTVRVLPVITTQPLSHAAFVGSSVSMICAVTATPTPTYQWQKGGINIPGATSSTLTLSNVQLSDAGSYGLVATNSNGSVTSRFARLVVLVSQQNAITYATTVSSTGVTAGGIVNFDYFVTNVGTKTWGANHYLSIRDVNNTFVAFSSLIGILPGETTTANLRFPAPATPGTYTYYVQGLEDGVEFFSTQTTVVLTVLAPVTNAITYNTTSFPVSAAPGSNVIFTYNVTNTGTGTWGGSHFLLLKNSSYTVISSAPLTVLAPGLSKTVNLSFTVPSTPGTYNYIVQATDSGPGDFPTRANLTLVVLAPQPNATVYNRVRYPDEAVPGAVLDLKYTLSNAGTQAWGATHYATLRDSNSTYLAFIPLTSTATGATKTVDFTLTAPTTPGTYTYYVQAMEDGIEFFSTQDVVNVKVDALPLGNAVSYNASTFPLTAARGATVNFTANVTNRGTRAWGSTHYLSFRDVDNTFLAFPSLNGVVPGASRTLNLSFVAPTTSGIYTYTLQAFEDGVAFFEMADTVVLTVP